MLACGWWYAVKDGEMAVRAMLNRHYSGQHYKDNRKVRLSAGPGEKMILCTADYSAVLIWRKFRDASGQVGINCAMFRNESNLLSSMLIIEAEQLAWQRWPGERLYTYVNPRKIKSTNPGYCFIKAGWTKLPYATKNNKLVILEKLAGSA